MTRDTECVREEAVLLLVAAAASWLACPMPLPSTSGHGWVGVFRNTKQTHKAATSNPQPTHSAHRTQAATSCQQQPATRRAVRGTPAEHGGGLWRRAAHDAHCWTWVARPSHRVRHANHQPPAARPAERAMRDASQARNCCRHLRNAPACHVPCSMVMLQPPGAATGGSWPR